MNHRKDFEDILIRDGYRIVERTSDVSDPFAWSIRCAKGDYEILIQERALALADR